MSNLQIKGMDERLYQELKRLAAGENRSVSQQVLHWIRRHLAQKAGEGETAAEVLLDLAGSWEDDRTADQIAGDLRSRRRSSRKLAEGL